MLLTAYAGAPALLRPCGWTPPPPLLLVLLLLLLVLLLVLLPLMAALVEVVVEVVEVVVEVVEVAAAIGYDAECLADLSFNFFLSSGQRSRVGLSKSRKPIRVGQNPESDPIVLKSKRSTV